MMKVKTSKKSTTEGGAAGYKKKIRFRPRKSHLTQLLMHTKVKFINAYMSHLLLLGKFEYTRGPIFKVVLEC